MRTKKIDGKLNLNKQTVVNLELDAMKRVYGGAPESYVLYDCPVPFFPIPDEFTHCC